MTVEESRPGVRRNTGERQLCSIVGKSWIGEGTALTMPIPMDLCSTEAMATTSQNEAARERVFTLRPGHTPVKSENVMAAGDSSESELVMDETTSCS
jgi:hypothetical protein